MHASLARTSLRPTLFALLVLAGAALRLPAQVTPSRERRVAVPVDYVAGADIYVALGERDGLAAGDTLNAYRGATGERAGIMVARIVTVRRAVLTYGADRFPVAVGDTLWLGVLRAPQVAVTDSVRADSAGLVPPPPGGPFRVAPVARRSARLDGSMALDLDAIQSDAFPGEVRRFTTPTFRLHAVASELPGGIRLATNVRASRRFSSIGGNSPMTSLRVYQASVEKTFTAVPLRLQAGRFSTALQPYGGYWDGMLARVGGERFGVGGAIGFLPQQTDEEFSTDVPRMSAFADYHARGGPIRYDAELGVHALRPSARYADQTFAGFAQRLRLGELWLSQSLQLDRGADNGWTLSAVQLHATVPLTAGVVARVGGSRHRPAELGGESPLPSFYRDRGSAGVAYYHRRFSINADVSASRRADGRTTSAFSASAFVPRAPAGFGLSASATWSDNELFRSMFLSGELSRHLGPVFVRAAYRATRFDGLLTGTRSDGAELTLSLPLAGRSQLLVRAENWWGDAGGGRQRVFTSISTGF